MEFRKGDQVRCVRASGRGELTEGAEYTVAGANPYVLSLEGMWPCGYCKTRFELIQRTEWRVGDKVLLQNGAEGEIKSFGKSSIFASFPGWSAYYVPSELWPAEFPRPAAKAPEAAPAAPFGWPDASPAECTVKAAQGFIGQRVAYTSYDGVKREGVCQDVRLVGGQPRALVEPKPGANRDLVHPDRLTLLVGPAIPSEAARRKARPLARGCFAYFPDFLALLADVAVDGFHYNTEAENVLGLVVAHQDENEAVDLALSLLAELQTHLKGACLTKGSGLLGGFGDALEEVAAVSLKATEQHHPGGPMHWEAGKSTDHADCLARHYKDHCKGEHVDTDGQLHLAKSCWRALAIGQTALEATFPELKARREAQRLAAARGEGIPG